MIKSRKLICYVLLPIISAILGCGLLFLAALVPESLIFDNCIKSSEEMVAMGDNSAAIPSFDDFSFYYDNHTDRLIIMEAYTMSGKNPSSIILNPYYSDPDDNNIEAFGKLLADEVETNVEYFRYWQGFRIFIRPLLAVTSYFGILELVAIVFFTLFATTIIFAASKYGKAAAAMFALAVAIFKPAVVAFSLQYASCFLLMFGFSIFILKRKVSYTKAPFVFCIFGILTQFFDFYTNPPLTYAIPVIFLIMDEDYSDKRWKTVLKTFGAWIYGYISMWLVKLSLSSFALGENGFSDGFHSLKYRLGSNLNPGIETVLDIKNALVNAWWTGCPGENELLVFLILAVLIIAATFLLLKNKGVSALVSCGAFLAVALVPVLWTAVAAQPMNIHAWIQHRILLALYFGIFMFFVQAIRECHS